MARFKTAIKLWVGIGIVAVGAVSAKAIIDRPAVRTMLDRSAPTAPTLPQVLPSLPPAYTDTVFVATGGALQAAINAATAGTAILLTPGVTYTGNYTLPNRGDAGWVKIAGDLVTSTTNRVDTTLNFPVVTCTGGNCTAINANVNGSDGWELSLLEITSNQSFTNAPLRFHVGGVDVPDRILVDRVYIHPLTPTNNFTRCMIANASNITIRYSVLVECHNIGQQAQAISVWNSPGPYHIHNNLLSGSGQALIFGGASPAAGNSPSDITIQKNFFFLPPAWRTQYTAHTATFELKDAHRVLFEDNQIRGGSFGMLLKSVDQNGVCPTTCGVEDLTIRRNTIRNTGSGFNMSRKAEGGPAIHMRRVSISELWMDSLGASGTWNFSGSGRQMQLLDAPDDLEIQGYTSSPKPNHSWLLMGGRVPLDTLGTSFSFHDVHIRHAGSFGFFTDGGTSIPNWYVENSWFDVYGLCQSGNSPSCVASPIPASAGADTVLIATGHCGVISGDFSLCGPGVVQADISIGKVGPDSVGLSDVFWYVLTTTNSGPDSAQDVIVVDSLPSAVTYAASNRSSTHSAGVVTWPSVNMASGTSLIDSVQVTAPGTQQVVLNKAVVTTTTTDPDAGDRVATKSTLVSDTPTPPAAGDTVYLSTLNSFFDVTNPTIGSGLGAHQQGGSFGSGGFLTTLASERVVVPHTSVGIDLDYGTAIFTFIPNFNSSDDVKRDIFFLSSWATPGFHFGKHETVNGNGLYFQWWNGASQGHFIETLSDTTYLGWSAGDTVTFRITWDVNDAPDVIRAWQGTCEVTAIQTNVSGSQTGGTEADSIQIGARKDPGWFSDIRMMNLILLDTAIVEAAPNCDPPQPVGSTFGNGVWISQHTYVSRTFSGFTFAAVRQDSMPACAYRITSKTIPPAPADTFLVRSLCAPPVAAYDSVRVDSLVANWGVARITVPFLRNTPIGG